MHFFDWNIGDYAKKTQHLTNDEDLAYRRLLDMYYDTEQPITHGLATLSRRLRVDEKSIQNVLDEFFPNGINKHADEKIAAYHAYLEKQKLNGRKGGRPTHKPTDNPMVSQNNPVPSQLLTTKPLTTNQLKPSAAFALPDWINSEDWNLWIKTRKGKKLIHEQMEANVKKLEKWKIAGLDYGKALKDAALAGWQGLHEPNNQFTAKQDSMKRTGDLLTGRNRENEPFTIDMD